MSIESRPGGPDAPAASLPNLFQIRRSRAAVDYVPEMWWMLAAQFLVLIALLVVVVVL
ncbi:hypothetical protein [Mycobacterium camsae]|uniref:hypothetical protein n=1 Tax=Mycobacterium gordonae TaxID=1778 RepID=UPI0019821F6A|nr:hypothetical protein [Mycobacterium gordonae]